MAWSAIRRATESDVENLRRAAERFCDRHGLHYTDDENDARLTIDCVTTDRSNVDAKYLDRLWTRIVRRALYSKYATGIAYGYVGFSVD